MRATPLQAAGPGLFIASEAIGLVFARAWGNVATFPLWPVLACLALAALISTMVPRSDASAPLSSSSPIRARTVAVVVGLLLVAITVRSLIGLRVSALFVQHAGWALPLAVATFAGKAFGGLAADWLGWRRTSVVALSASVVLMVLAGDHLPRPPTDLPGRTTSRIAARILPAGEAHGLGAGACVRVVAARLEPMSSSMAVCIEAWR